MRRGNDVFTAINLQLWITAIPFLRLGGSHVEKVDLLKIFLLCIGKQVVELSRDNLKCLFKANHKWCIPYNNHCKSM